MTYYCIMDSPVGDLLLRGTAKQVQEIAFSRGSRKFKIEPDWREGAEVLDRAVAQLEEYFAGQRQRFELPLGPEGTEFQRRVWQELRRIPFGGIISYGELARELGVVFPA